MFMGQDRKVKKIQGVRFFPILFFTVEQFQGKKYMRTTKEMRLFLLYYNLRNRHASFFSLLNSANLTFRWFKAANEISEERTFCISRNTELGKYVKLSWIQTMYRTALSIFANYFKRTLGGKEDLLFCFKRAQCSAGTDWDAIDFQQQGLDRYSYYSKSMIILADGLLSGSSSVQA